MAFWHDDDTTKHDKINKKPSSQPDENKVRTHTKSNK